MTTLNLMSVKDLGKLMREHVYNVDMAAFDRLPEGVDRQEVLAKASEVLKAVSEELQRREVRPLSLVEIEQRDHPERWQKAREEMRAERRVARDEERREIKCVALREAAELLKPYSGIGLANGASRADVSEWLSQRADALESGE